MNLQAHDSVRMRDSGSTNRQHAAVASALAGVGWIVLDDWLPPHEWQALAQACRGHAVAGGLEPAAIGRGAAHHFAPLLRGDRTRWLDAVDAADARVLARLDALGAHLNRTLFLGLRRVEAHYALYPPGARYARHRDRFRDDDARVLSAVCYLNADWSADCGGALRMYPPDGTAPHDVLPIGGRLVIFRADTIEHEVLPAHRDRLSIAAWLRRD